LSEDSHHDRRADCGVDGHASTTDERAVHAVTPTSPAAAATLHHSHASHAGTATQGPRTQARTVNVTETPQNFELRNYCGSNAVQNTYPTLKQLVLSCQSYFYKV